MIVIKETRNVDLLTKTRMEVIDCVFGHPSSKVMSDLAAANRHYYETHLADGTHKACLAYDDATLCGSGALCLYDEMPSPDNSSGRCAYIMNVYVKPDYRRRGVATEIVDWLVDKAKATGAGKIYLETTEGARSLYRDLGFEEMDNMMKYEDSCNRLA